MSNNNNNSQANLTTSQIKKATLLAVVSSFIIAIVAVLPAGYNKDFTGLGNMAGSFIAPFEGRHGWYFSNKTNEAIKVTFQFSGTYELVK